MFVNVNGTRVRYECMGEGDSIILLHGWGGQIESLLPLQTHLARHRRVYALDFPGFGRSDFPPVAWSVGDYASCVLAFMDKIEVRKADLLGHSFGGRVAIKIAATQPERVQRLILVNSAGVCQSQVGWRLKFITRLAKLGKSIIDRLPKPLHVRVRWWFYQAIDSTDYLTAGRLSGTFSKVVSENLEPILPAISAPTLLIWGKKDQATPLEDGRIMARKIPNAKLVILPKAGHFSFLDQPVEANQALDNFLFDSSDLKSA